MEIKYVLEKDRVINFFTEKVLYTKRSKLALLLVSIFFVPLMFYASYDILKFIWSEKLILIQFILVEILMIFFNKPILRSSFKKLLEENYKKEKYEYWFSEINIKVYDDSLEYKTTINTTTYELSYIKSIHCTFEYIFIIFKNKKLILIPNNTFNLYEEKLKFISFLEEKSNVKTVDSYPENLKYI